MLRSVRTLPSRTQWGDSSTASMKGICNNMYMYFDSVLSDMLPNLTQSYLVKSCYDCPSFISCTKRVSSIYDNVKNCNWRENYLPYNDEIHVVQTISVDLVKLTGCNFTTDTRPGIRPSSVCRCWMFWCPWLSMWGQRMVWPVDQRS